MQASIRTITGVLSAVWLLMPHDLPAQGSPATSVQRVHEALQRGEWATAVDLIHPDRLRRVRDRELSFLLAWAEHHRDLLRERSASDGPVGIGVDGVVSPEKLSAFGSFRLEKVSGRPTIQELAALSPREFFVQAFTALTQSFGSIEEPQTVTALHVIDTVYENDLLAHVLYRATDDSDHGEGLWSVSVISLANVVDQWLLLDESLLVPPPSFALLLFARSP